MKIWYQTASTYRYDPSRELYGTSLEEQCRQVVRPDTEVYVAGVPASQMGIDRFKSIMYFHSSQIINHILRAEKEGYDAVVIGNSFDVGFEEAREMLSIPVVSIAHANFHMAAMLGELFTVLTCQYHIAERYRQLVRRYGLDDKFLKGVYVYEIPEIDLVRGCSEPEKVTAEFRIVAERAVADGASVIIPIPAPIYQLFQRTGGMNNISGATILDPVTVSLKTAEMMVDLKRNGIEVSRKPGVYGSPGKDLLQQALKTYTPVFKIES